MPKDTNIMLNTLRPYVQSGATVTVVYSSDSYETSIASGEVRIIEEGKYPRVTIGSTLMDVYSIEFLIPGKAVDAWGVDVDNELVHDG